MGIGISSLSDIQPAASDQLRVFCEMLHFGASILGGLTLARLLQNSQCPAWFTFKLLTERKPFSKLQSFP